MDFEYRNVKREIREIESLYFAIWHKYRRINRLTALGSSIGHFFRGTAFGYIFLRDFALVPFFGNIQAAVTAAEFFDIRNTVNTGAKDVSVQFPVTRKQAAGTAHVQY